MANAKISSQELVLRNLTDSPPANAASNSLRLYADGTNLWSIDSSGNVVNISAGSINNGEINTAANLGSDANKEGIFSNKAASELQFKSLVPGTNITMTSTNDEITINSTGGSGSSTFEGLSDTPSAIGDEHAVLHVTGTGGTGIDFSNFLIDDASAALYHAVAGSGKIGKVDSPISASYQTSVFLQDAAQNPSADNDYCSVVGANTTLEFKSKFDSVNSVCTYVFQDNGTGTGTRLAIQGNGNDFSLVASSTLNTQNYTLPSTIGTNGQVLTLGSVTGTNGTLSWTTASGGGSPGGAQYDIQINDGSNGFTESNWAIDTSAGSNLLPDTTQASDLGSPAKAVKKLFAGAYDASNPDCGGLFLASASSANSLNQYASITSDGTHGSIHHQALADAGGVYHYKFKAADNASAEVQIEGNSNYWGFKTDSTMAATQIARLPSTGPGADGKALVTDTASGYAGNNFDLKWKSLSNRAQVLVTPSMMTRYSNSVTGTGMGKQSFLAGFPAAGCSIYADSAVDPGDTGRVFFNIDNIIFTDATTAGEIGTSGNAMAFHFFFDHFVAGDTLDIVILMSYVGFEDGVASSSFTNATVTKTLTLSNVSGGTMGILSLSVAEVNSLLPADTAAKLSGTKSGSKWLGGISFTLQNFSASATNADAFFANDGAQQGPVYGSGIVAGLFLKNVE